MSTIFNSQLELSNDETIDDPSGHGTKLPYEGYRDSNLPEGYTPYRPNERAEEIYDTYEYTGEESSNDQIPKKSLCISFKSCCSDMGRLIRKLEL